MTLNGFLETEFGGPKSLLVAFGHLCTDRCQHSTCIISLFKKSKGSHSLMGDWGKAMLERHRVLDTALERRD